MKKRNLVINFLVLLVLVVTLAACAATRTNESAGKQVDDSGIRIINTK